MLSAFLALTVALGIPAAGSRETKTVDPAGDDAVTAALAGKLSQGTIAIVRENGKKYKVAFAPVPIANAAKYTRSVPKEYIAKNGHDVTQAFIDYAKPIVGELPACEIF